MKKIIVSGSFKTVGATETGVVISTIGTLNINGGIPCNLKGLQLIYSGGVTGDQVGDYVKSFTGIAKLAINGNAIAVRANNEQCNLNVSSCVAVDNLDLVAFYEVVAETSDIDLFYYLIAEIE